MARGEPRSEHDYPAIEAEQKHFIADRHQVVVQLETDKVVHVVTDLGVKSNPGKADW
jgi:hypothetical protein